MHISREERVKVCGIFLTLERIHQIVASYLKNIALTFECRCAAKRFVWIFLNSLTLRFEFI